MKLIMIEQCQHNEPLAGSTANRPFPYYPIRRAYHLLKTEGPQEILRKVRQKLVKRRPEARPFIDGEVLNLQPGEWVAVKSHSEIMATLDERRTCRGLSFVEEMNWYCGKQFRVYKRLERMFLEESKKYRSLKNTVLLEGVHCHGTGIDCDRSCFLFWREAWLRRIPPPDHRPAA